MQSLWAMNVATIQELDLELARKLQEYQNGYGYEDRVFDPCEEHLQDLQDWISAKLIQVRLLPDDFWRMHFTQFLESFDVRVTIDRKLPYTFISRPSSKLDQVSTSDPRDVDTRISLLVGCLSELPESLASIYTLVEKSSDLGRSQVAQTLKSFFKNIDQAVQFVEQNSSNKSLAREAKDNGDRAKEAAKRIESIVKVLPLKTLEAVDLPFELTLEKGMQVPLDYILSWYEGDVEMRREQFFKMAEEIDPARDAYDLLNNGSVGYKTAEEMFKGAKETLTHLRESALNFVNLPEGEICDVAATPDAWKTVCPTAMYTGNNVFLRVLKGTVCLNDDNLPAFSRGSLEETNSHEVYPGHHTHSVKTASTNLPYTFRLNLPMTRCLIEGIAHRSEYLLIPYYKDPIAKLEAARRGWYCSTRVKAEVDLNYHRKPVADIVDNYVKNLNCTEYSANGQMYAHLMLPADAVSYYTGMRVLEDLYPRTGMSMKDFTDETFNYGNVSLKTIEMIFDLSAEQQQMLKEFQPLPFTAKT